MTVEQRTRIEWSHEECGKIAERLAILRSADLWSSIGPLFNQAQNECLPEYRRRSLPSVKMAPSAFLSIWKEKERELIKRMAAPVASTPELEAEPVLITLPEDKPTDIKKELDGLSIGYIVGYLVDRIGPLAALLFGDKLKDERISKLVAPIHHPGTNGHGAVSGTVAEKKPWRVLVWGPKGDQIKNIEEKIKDLTNIEARFETDRTHLKAHYDKVVFMTKFGGHPSYNDLKSRYKVFEVNGGLTDVVQKLRDINSMQR